MARAAGVQGAPQPTEAVRAFLGLKCDLRAAAITVLGKAEVAGPNPAELIMLS
jgi:hypothetical protein